VADADMAVMEPEAAAPDAGDAAPAVSKQLVVSYWLADAARSRLAASGALEIVDDAERAREAALIVISTRVPAGSSLAFVGELRASTSCPIVAIVHPGGEDVAVELLAVGASSLVAEGNEEAVAALLGGESDETRLLENYELSLDRLANGIRSAGQRDHVTGLRGAADLAARLAGGTGGPMPRLGFARIIGLEDALRRMSVDARDLLRRRLALQIDEMCRSRSSEVFSTSSAEFAIVSEGLTLAEFEALATDLIEATAGFSPDRSRLLAMAFGHAGPEATSYAETLRELALRGMELAAEQPEQGVVGAERLALTLAASTELDSAMRAIAIVEARDAYPPSHGERVAQHAVAIAEAIGIKERDLTKVRLAARLHDVGKLGLSDEAAAASAEKVPPEAKEAYESHAARGFDILLAPAGADIAAAVRAHHENWDGTGFPDGLSASAIPMAARIIAVADALDRWSVNGSAPDRPTPEALQKVNDAAETMFDPAVVEACNDVFET
jgi:HD-GYP domain-containing protein (c-di-GMP phosphodiesterase class II)